MTAISDRLKYLRSAAPEAAPVDGWVGEIECGDAKGMWLVMTPNCPLVPGQRVLVTAAPTREAATVVSNESSNLSHNATCVSQTRDNGIAQGEQGDSHAFKNFHRMLCERFEYCHDEKDWRRDQVSLMEHIANLTRQPAPPAEPVDLSELLAAVDEVVRITDRKHNAWDRLKAALTAAKAAQPESGDKP
jgi:hypothetical protein